MSVHERPVGATVEWYTPRSLFRALGDPVFDLDPAAANGPALTRSAVMAAVARRQYEALPPEEQARIAREWDDLSEFERAELRAEVELDLL